MGGVVGRIGAGPEPGTAGTTQEHPSVAVAQHIQPPYQVPAVAQWSEVWSECPEEVGSNRCGEPPGVGRAIQEVQGGERGHSASLRGAQRITVSGFRERVRRNFKPKYRLRYWLGQRGVLMISL